MRFLFDEYVATHRALAIFDIDYRLAPEFRHPTQLNDCLDAMHFIRDNAVRFNLDLSRVMVMGESAGGNLAAAISQNALNDVNEQQIHHEILIVPAVDWSPDDWSFQSYGTGYALSTKKTRYFYHMWTGTEVRERERERERTKK
jgi:acetyl esterase